MHLVSHSVSSLFLLFFFSFSLYISPKGAVPTDACDVNAAVSGALDKRCYEEGILLQWQNRELWIAGEFSGCREQDVLVAEHFLSPEPLQRCWDKWIICVAPGVEVNL